MSKLGSSQKDWIMKAFVSPIRGLVRIPAKMLILLYREGPVATWRWIMFHIGWRYQEWRLGIRTAQFVDWQALGGDPRRMDYEPISYECFDIAMRHLVVCQRRDVFLDYGSGKGRAVILAAMRPFRKVLGVERSPELCELARENLSHAADKLVCRDVEIVHADAVQFEVPDDVSVIFLFNPFTGPVLEGAITRIHESYLRNPRSLSIIYMLPEQQDNPFMQCPWLTTHCELPTGIWKNMRFLHFEAHGGLVQTTGFAETTHESTAEVRM
jgi:SAM-dependent methyltransferase